SSPKNSPSSTTRSIPASAWTRPNRRLTLMTSTAVDTRDGAAQRRSGEAITERERRTLPLSDQDLLDAVDLRKGAERRWDMHEFDGRLHAESTPFERQQNGYCSRVDRRKLPEIDLTVRRPRQASRRGKHATGIGVSQRSRVSPAPAARAR